MFIDILKAALEAVPDLTGRVCPLGVEKGRRPPLAVYRKAREEELGGLDGGTGLWNASAVVDLAAADHDALQRLEAAAVAAIRAAEGQTLAGVRLLSVTAAHAQSEELEPETLYHTGTLAVTALWQQVDGDG